MNYYIKIISNKAKNDVNSIVESIGYRNLVPESHQSDMFTRFGIKLLGIANILFCLKRDDVLFLQYPMKKFYTPACIFAHLKGAKVITLVHDLGAFRRHKLSPEEETKLLNKSDFIIIHNQSMMKWLQEHHVKSRLHCLEIFDYLSPSVPAIYSAPHKEWKIVYAGGLGLWRNAFLYKLDPVINSWQMELYGKGLDSKQEKEWNRISYHGCLTPDNLLATAEGDFGLVWDGDDLDKCSGDWGEYLKINNPHKCSFYLRCQLPVIIWEEAALAPFIKESGSGLCVKTLADIDKTLQDITPQQYLQMKEKAAIIGEKLSQGYFTKQALAAAGIFFQSKQS